MTGRSLSDLIEQGRASTSASTRLLAESSALTLRALQTALGEDRARPATTRRQPKIKRKSPTGPLAWDKQTARLDALGVTAADVRAWGADHGHAVTAGPMLRTELVDAYEQAHQQQTQETR